MAGMLLSPSNGVRVCSLGDVAASGRSDVFHESLPRDGKGLCRRYIIGRGGFIAMLDQEP